MLIEDVQVTDDIFECSLIDLKIYLDIYEQSNIKIRMNKEESTLFFISRFSKYKNSTIFYFVARKNPYFYHNNASKVK